MGSGKFVYNSKTLTINNIVECNRTMREDRYDNFSVSKKHEAVSFGGQDVIGLVIQSLPRAQVFDFFDWWSWARLGNQFAFALFSTQDESTTLDGAATSGQKVIPLTSTTGFSVGEYCLIKEALAAGDDFEIIQIASISAGVSVTAVENLLNTYASADIFRHMEYWPTVVVDVTEFSLPLRGPGINQSFRIPLIEVTA